MALVTERKVMLFVFLNCYDKNDNILGNYLGNALAHIGSKPNKIMINCQ